MSDYLIRAAARPLLGRLMRKLNIPTPVRLKRVDEAFKPDCLRDRHYVVGHGTNARLEDKISSVLYTGIASATDVKSMSPDDRGRYDGLILDVTGMQSVNDLSRLYRLGQPPLRRIARGGRIVVLADAPASLTSASAIAAARAVDGFVRSLAKEVGRFGTTANTLYVDSGGGSRIAEPLRFLLSDHSTFVDGQALTLSANGRAPGSVPTRATLEDKIAVVTGAAQGIGARVAARLAGEGAHVVAVDRPAHQVQLDALVESIGGTALALDITDERAATELADLCWTDYGGLDILVHNAGVTRDRSLANMSGGEWQEVCAVNLQAVLAIDSEMARRRLFREHARVVCMSSVAGIAGNRGQTNYAATKAGLIGFVQARAEDQRGRGVCYNAVAPGFIETEMTEAMPFTVREAGRRLSSLGQGGTPDDVAATVAFLSTPGAGGLSGNVVRVCGQSLLGA